MGKSARILGEELGLTAQEMNQLLKDQNFLEGEPGAYTVTEKGLEYAKETDFHRGPGGSPWYNRDWTQRTWDDSILDALDTSPERCQAARDQIANARRSNWDKIKADRAEASAAFRASRPDLFPEEAKTNNVPPVQVNQQNGMSGLAKTGVVVGGVAAALGIGYGIYKAAPYIKKWWHEKVIPFFKGEDTDE